MLIMPMTFKVEDSDSVLNFRELKVLFCLKKVYEYIKVIFELSGILTGLKDILNKNLIFWTLY